MGTSSNKNSKKKTLKKGSSSKNDNQKQHKKKNESSTTTTETNHDDNNDSDVSSSSWKTTVKEHWLVHLFLISIVVCAPYVAYYYGYCYALLQHRGFFGRLLPPSLQPRPTVEIADPRQVLIVGSMSSGTSQASHDLSKHLGLEIGHETSDTLWNFVRDGTVSWFHGVRFLPPFGDDGVAFRSIFNLCRNFTENMGFHPRMYRPSNRCVEIGPGSASWSNCWRRECADLLSREWSCAYNNNENNNGKNKNCETPYQRALLQVRHPLRIIESLTSKFCIDGIDGTIQPAFTKFVTALFPHLETILQEEDDDDSSEACSSSGNGDDTTCGSSGVPFANLTCVEASSYYVLEYYRAMLEAMKHGHIHGQYSIETATPCSIARQAGFLEHDTLLYKPHHDRLVGLCGASNEHDQDHPANQPIQSTVYRVNKNQVQLDYDDLLRLPPITRPATTESPTPTPPPSSSDGDENESEFGGSTAASNEKAIQRRKKLQAQIRNLAKDLGYVEIGFEKSSAKVVDEL